MATVHCLPESVTGTAQYLVVDNATKDSVLIDTVWEYDADSGCTSNANVDKLCELIAKHGAQVKYILETHTHADHLTAANQLKQRLGASVKLATGQGIDKVQATWKPFFNMAHLATDGSQWDRLLKEGDEIHFGKSVLRVFNTPGHTMDSITYELVGDGLFVGDTLFAPDKGTARCDFPGGDANVLHDSIKRILSYPPATKIYLCHDYPGTERTFRYETTVQEELERNVHLQKGGQEFVALRKARDATLKIPHLLLPAIQVNIDAGKLPPAESNGTAYIKIPLNAPLPQPNL